MNYVTRRLVFGGCATYLVFVYRDDYWLLLFLFNQKYKKSFFDIEKENKAIRDRRIRDFRNLFEQKEDYYIITNQKERVISAAIITSNMKIMLTEIKHYPLNNMVMKLGHT